MSSSPATLLSRIGDLLGLTPDDIDPGRSTPSLEALLRRTRRQLLECGHYLGLTGIQRLTKHALASRFLEALQALTGSAPGEVSDARDRPREFDLGQPTRKAPEAEHIPWGYGQDRVTATIVDPERLYVYWEISDEAIERARANLGSGGREAWLNLRIYDVTGRIFDGTNAHGYFDHSVARSDRQWFFFIGKPASTAVVELGLKSREGYFVRVARSGRADFPRREPVSPGGVQWLTVRAGAGGIGEPSGDMHPAAVIPARAAHVEPVRVWDIRRTHATANGEWIARDESFGHEWTVFEREAGRRIEWEGPLERTSWEVGPFPYPVEPAPYVEERDAGTVTVRSVDGQTHVVYGPWQVLIRGLAARAERTILAVWELRRSWIADAGVAGQTGAVLSRAAGGSEQMHGASELRLGGASELYRRGASELRYLGASETFYAAASEWRLGGASELRFVGASEWRYAGASEKRFAGASERQQRAANDDALGYPNA